MLTVTQLASMVEQKLGGDVPAALAMGQTAPLDVLWIANRAGEVLYNAHEWSFRLAPPVTIDFAASQEYVDLPSDFGSLEGYSVSDQINGSFRFTSYKDWLEHKSTQTPQRDYFGVILYPGQSAATDDFDAPRLYLTPTPDAAISPAMELIFTRNWTQLADATSKPNLPSWTEMLYVELVREMAQGFVADRMEEAVAKVLGGPTFLSAREKDGMIQPDLGYLTGGPLSTQMVRDPMINTVPAPS